ncbi:MAG TPA: hypothetical protein VL068_02940 [Microthrixaceae bacterium]|nr:hypothetical protein [Microthrixaceae bacterium]
MSFRAFMMMSVVAFFVVLLGAVTIQSQRIEGQRNLDLTAARMRTQASRSLDLRAEVATRESPERIMSKAKEMGMVDPGPVAPLSSVGAGTGVPAAPDHNVSGDNVAGGIQP